ncbi:SDR family NAD(P)-dependent oxidoreductase [Spirosoma sp. HMF4905]|uniref:SDR family NAD(P)-dependent oxidoreductase n=1 Tax=Spirosoma arboris TaxID=2682092 RepID=A0A7K1SHW7_9BACT|nr:SDR family NAD(P)-dependent oxidoreductase [Spirosoma arboris]MVM33392.1 SDR family NAD(P)-dependent oxidoreductase [Spirosoma arboris]
MRISIPTKAVLWTVAGVTAWTAIKAILAQKRKLDFRGKTVVITGGSRGLGLELARVLAQEGANLAICAREADGVRRQVKVDKWGGNGKRQFPKLFHLNHLSNVQIGQIIPV